MEENIHSWTDSPTGWARTTYAEQCPSKCWGVLFMCQGIAGHEGLCWCYSSAGHFEQWSIDGGSSSCPPGHEDWVHPKDMQDKFWMNHRTTVPCPAPEGWDDEQ